MRASYPIQARSRGSSSTATVNRHLYLAAYEVYAHVFAPQQALLEDGCRGGFGVGEMMAFLYARSFPKSEWRQRVDEAMIGLDVS
jgi:hypothetical protein